ncbi:MAG: serine/threonine protein kinase [Myxococcaceae bacterium]|nr:serine/threonine protein kinase [Myxococcaceae bacterium]
MATQLDLTTLCLVADTLPVQGRLAKGSTPFGPFLLQRRLGAGGMAETYLAERRTRTAETGDVLTPFGRAVCLKLILPQHLADPTFQGWFFDEARIHSHLHHDNIVQVYDFGELDGRAYLVLEYVEGCDLRVLMSMLRAEGKLLPTRLVVAVAHELAAALDCAHQLTIAGEPQKLVHRDVSPHNVLLSLHGHAKLCDFGVVKAHSRVMRTETGGVKGKVPYMSPEQLSAPNTIDARTDLFALGVVLFELLTGQHPFRVTGDETDMEVARRIFEGTRARVLELAPKTAVGLAELVEQLLATDVDQRVPSAARLMWLLEAQVDAPTAGTSRELAAYVQAARAGGMPPSALVHAHPIPLVDEGTSWKRDPRGAKGQAAPDVGSSAATRSQGRTWPPSGRKAVGVLAAAIALSLTAFALAWAVRRPREEPVSQTASPGAREPAPSAPPRALPVAKANDDWSSSATPQPAGAEPQTHAAEKQKALAAAEDRGVKESPADVRHTLHSRHTAAHGPAVAAITEQAVLDAWLDISVQPDGQNWRVWVDGQYQGSADVKVKVAAGKHLVAIGLDQPSRQRSVRVAPNSLRSLSFKHP